MEKKDGKRPAAKGRAHVGRYQRKRDPERKQAADREIAARIHYARVEILGMERQVDFASVLGVTRGAVGNWEQGKGVKRESLQAISETFGISLEWLATGKGQPRTRPTLLNRLELLPPADYASLYRTFETLLKQREDEIRARDGGKEKQ